MIILIVWLAVDGIMRCYLAVRTLLHLQCMNIRTNQPQKKMSAKMKKAKPAMALCMILISMSIATLCAAELRDWTSNKGSTLKAELVSKTDTHVTLRTDSGKEMSVAIKQLSDDDQEYLKEIDAENSAQKTDAADAGNDRKAGKRGADLLPVLRDGKGAGYFAHFEGDHYLARINSNGTMDLLLKDKKQASGLLEEWKIVVQPIAYKKNKLGTITANRIMEILKHGEPVQEPKMVELSVKLKSDIKCDLIYEFTPTGISTWMRSEHGSDPPEVMNHMMTHYFKDIRGLTKDPKDLKKMRLKIESDKYDYATKHKISSIASRDDYEITMPAITDTKITLEKGSDKNIRLMSWKYGDSELSKGFYIRARKGDYNSTKHAAEKTTIRFKGK